MLSTVTRIAAISLAALAIVAAASYVAGVRLAYDGGGRPRLALLPSANEQAELIARHRETQRAGTMQPADAPVQASQEPLPAVASDGEEGQPEEVGRAAYWTDFRGPRRDGHYRERAITTIWPEDGLRPAWKQPIGGGYASFVAAQGRAFTIEQRGEEEVVAAYDVASGRELWTHGWPALFSERMGGDGPRATPVWSEGRLVALGGTGELRALDAATGRLLWRTNILQDAGASNLEWGMAASPLVVDGSVVVLPGGPRGRSVMAYDLRSGTPAWMALEDKPAYSSPMLVTLAGVRQILVLTAARLVALSPDGGRVLWEYPWRTSFDINASQPLIVGEDRVFVSTGYGTGAAVLELTTGDEGLSAREVWRNVRMKNRFTSSVLHDGFIYGLDESILACLDAATGELQWKGGRYGYGHVMLASGHLIVLTEDGDLALVRATPDRHEELVRVRAIEGKTWNHPAMSDGYLLVRNIREMAAFDLRLPPATRSE